MSYEIEFTPLAKAFAETKSSVVDVERLMREEIDSVALGETPNGLYGREIAGQLFLAEAYGDGKVLLDTGTYEAGPVMDAGPFEGKRLMIPRPDSKDRDD